MVDGSRGINKKGAGGHSSVVWVASCCKKAPFRKHRRRYHKRCLFRIMEVINCSFIHIYKQSNRVIPSLGREIGNVGTYMQRQNHTCCQSSEYKFQKAFEKWCLKIAIDWVNLSSTWSDSFLFFVVMSFFLLLLNKKRTSMAWKLLLRIYRF